MRRGRELIMRLQHTSPPQYFATNQQLHCNNGRLQLRYGRHKLFKKESFSGNLKTTAGKKITLKTKNTAHKTKKPQRKQKLLAKL